LQFRVDDHDHGFVRHGYLRLEVVRRGAVHATDVESDGQRVDVATLGGLAASMWRGVEGRRFPLADRDDLAEAVIGTSNVPGPLPFFGVAAALLFASSAVQNRPPWPKRSRRLALGASAGVLGGRDVLGLAGKTSLVSRDSDRARFRRLDRHFYARLCL
jgi:hypothetical protein